MFGMGTQEILLIVLVVFLFFGGKKIPELMKGLGKGVRSFKDGMNNIEKEVNMPEDVSVDTEKKTIMVKDTQSFGDTLMCYVRRSAESSP